MQTTHDRLEVRHLRLVQAIAREGSVTRAGGVLHLSQSAVSHQLVDLERDLGTRLFDRVGKKMVLTDAGHRMVAAGERLLRELSALERELVSNKDTRQPFRVTTSCYTSYHWLPAALEVFGKTHPRIDLQIVFDAARRANDALMNDEVDLAILTSPPRDESLTIVEVCESELVVVAQKKDPLVAKKAHVRYSDLAQRTVLVHDGPNDHLLARLEEAVRASHEKRTGERLPNPITVRKVPLTEALIALARSGAGVAIVDQWIARGYLDRRVVALPLSPRASRRFYAAYRKSNPRSLPMEPLVKLIAGEASAQTQGT